MSLTPGLQANSHLAAAPALRAPACPAIADNDNEAELVHDGLLHAALRHFAEHGLGAAELAFYRAEQAFFAGNRKDHRYWLDICRALDRRLAASCSRPKDSGGERS